MTPSFAPYKSIARCRQRSGVSGIFILCDAILHRAAAFNCAASSVYEALTSHPSDMNGNRSATPRAVRSAQPPPAAVHLAEALAHADSAEPETFVQFDAGDVLEEDAGLKRPDAVSLRIRNQ